MCGGGSAGNDNSGTVQGEPTSSGVSTSATSGGRPDPGAVNAPDDGGDNMGVSQGLSQGARNAEQAAAAQAASRGYAANGDFGSANDFAAMARDLEAAAVSDGYGTKEAQTFDRTNGWGLGIGNRYAFGGIPAVVAPVVAKIENKIKDMIDNPWATVINVLATAVPVTAPIALARAGYNALAAFDVVPSIGKAVTAAVRGEYGVPGGQQVAVGQVDPVTGMRAEAQDRTVALSGNPGQDFGGGSDGGNWSQIASSLSTEQPAAVGSIAPTTVASTDRRTSYGFSPGQGVDYAELSGGFGGSNVGARSGWRQAGNVGGWA